MGLLDLLKRIFSFFPVFAVSSALSLVITGCVALSPSKSPVPVAPKAATPAAAPSVAAADHHGPNSEPQPAPEPDTVPAGAVAAPATSIADAPLLGPRNIDRVQTTQATNAHAYEPVEAHPKGLVTALQHKASPELGDTADTPVVSDADTSVTPASSKPRYTDLWDRIRDGFGLATLDDSRVGYHERWFVSNPNYMERKLKRARLYLYHIVQEVERRGMPMEIALLPAIESAYQPHAYSHARAVGLWQFIGPTARRYGLKINWWYDGRRDVVASTTAALNYLEELHEVFDGDWHLALAAYNAGEGKIQWAMEHNRRRGRPASYSYLRLKAETRHYVPKLLAFVNIVSDPEYYGVTLGPIPNEPYFARVDLGSQIDLNVVAKLAHVPVGDLYDINPGFRRWATDPNGPHQILVPVAKKETLIEGLNELPEGARIKWQRHKIRRGETLSTIARHYGMSVWAIKTANNLRGNLIRVGHNLMIPISNRALSRQIGNITRPLPSTRANPRGRAKIIHRVRKGETLWSIARRYRVYVYQLAKWNVMHPRDILRAGQRLKVWINPDRIPSI
ncbi:MAG: LysM peptidoglycan-binding domain-containing protein, partial [Acidiferrobacterales bacterium]